MRLAQTMDTLALSDGFTNEFRRVRAVVSFLGVCIFFNHYFMFNLFRPLPEPCGVINEPVHT